MDLFDVDQPNDARDECVRLLLELGAGGYNPDSPVMRRIIRDRFALARAPQLLNEAVIGVAIARRQRCEPMRRRATTMLPRVVSTAACLVCAALLSLLRRRQ